jgi:hypothetical protein
MCQLASLRPSSRVAQVEELERAVLAPLTNVAASPRRRGGAASEVAVTTRHV